MLRDQGCQTNATKAPLFVNSEGEVFRRDQTVISSVNVTDVGRRHGLTEDQIIKGGKKLDAAIAAEFERLRQKELSKRERKFVDHVDAVRDCTDFGRFRAYGQLNRRSELIVVCTEFIGIVEDKQLWANIEAMIEQTQAHYWVMSEEPNSEHSWRVYPDGHKKAGQKIPGSDKYGKNHGKMERQVELSWQVQDLSIPEVKRLLRKLRRQTDKVWPEAGVGVC